MDKQKPKSSVIPQNTWNVIIIGVPGVGKTTLYNFLTGQQELTSKQGEDCTQYCVANVLIDESYKVKITDSPGLKDGTDDIKWWSDLAEHCAVRLTILLFNGTIIRDSNMAKLLSVVNFLKVFNYNYLALAVHGYNYTNDNLDYFFLLKEEQIADKSYHEQNLQRASSSSCKGVLTQYDVLQIIQKQSIPSVPPKYPEYMLLSPLDIVRKFKQLQDENAALAEENKNIKEENNELKRSNRILNDKIVEFENRVTLLTSQLIASQKQLQDLTTLIGKKLQTLKNRFVSVDANSVSTPRLESRLQHLINWLPFAGNVQLEKRNTLILETYPDITSLTETEKEKN